MALASDMRERIIADWSWAAQAAKYRQFLYQLLGESVPEQTGSLQELMTV